MIKLKTEKDLDFLRISGKILANVLSELQNLANEGIRLTELDKKAREIIAKADARPAFLGYRPAGAKKSYPAAICTSVNNVVVHGIPSDYILKSGDILKIDAGVNYKGYFTDAAVTIGIGKISKEALQLIEVTKKALEEAITVAQAGNHLGDIGAAVEKVVKSAGFSVIRGLTGHGVGFAVHEEPTILNYGEKGTGLELKKGMVIAIEPMVTMGKGDILELEDGSYAAKDGSLTAHFEHTIYIDENKTEVLTKL
jgi:methionyl aminopeptidase